MNAVIYARYSSHNQREESIEGQIRVCTDYALKNNITIIDTYTDRAISGTSTDKRDAFNKMLRDSARKQFEVVLVYKLDRFARNKYDAATSRRKLKQNDVRVVSATEYIPETPEGVMLETMLEGMAQYYSENLAQNIKRGMKENALKGLSNGGPILLGYKIENKQIVIDSDKAIIVQKIFEMYADGKPIKEIQSYMKSRNANYNKSSMATLFSNQKYLGTYKYGDTIIDGGIPRIIDDTLFQRAQERIEKTKRAPARGKAKVDYILSGKLLCGLCGSNMLGESGTSKHGTTYNYYKCAKRKKEKSCDKQNVRKEEIEKIVIQYALDILNDDEIINAIADKLMEVQAQEKDNSQLKYLEGQLKDAQKQINNIVDAIAKGMFHASMRARMDSLESQVEELEIAIAKEKIAAPVYTKKMVVGYLRSLQNGSIEDTEYCKRMIDIFINSVYLFDDKMVISFNNSQNTEKISLQEMKQALEGFGLVPCGGALATKSEPFYTSKVFGFVIDIKK